MIEENNLSIPQGPIQRCIGVRRCGIRDTFNSTRSNSEPVLLAFVLETISFQFHKVQFRVVKSLAGKSEKQDFQFHKVQFRARLVRAYRVAFTTFNSTRSNSEYVLSALPRPCSGFQFHKVQFRAYLFYPKTPANPTCLAPNRHSQNRRLPIVQIGLLIDDKDK